MMIEPIKEPRVLIQKINGTVLIRSGHDDQAFYYYARLGEWLSESCVVVYFYHRSRFLDHIRLFGAKKVWLEFNNQRFMGELSLMQNNNGHDEMISLNLSILPLLEEDEKTGQKITLLT